ncbi:MAG: sulfotransferase domain-containing protein [Pseudomonadota bacterium]
MSKPDFLLIGAMKCGTTTLAAQLAAQDGIFLTVPKEPNYFSDDDVYTMGPDWYAALFADAGAGDLKGEASTHYTKLPTYPQTIARAKAALDAPKLVYLIRNPVERAMSHFHHGWSRGNLSEDVVAEFAANPEFIEYGRYAMQIAPWIDAFGVEAVHLTSLEALQARPQDILSEVARFIGHPGAVSWDESRARENVSSQRPRPLPLHGLLVDNPVAAALRRALVPKSLRTWIREKRQMTERPALPATLREALEVQFAEDHAALAQLFPAADLAPSYPFLSPLKGAAE